QGAGCSCRLNALLNGLCAIALCVGLYFIQHHKRGSACPTLDVFGCPYGTQLPLRTTACARALSSKGTALQGDSSLGRGTSRHIHSMSAKPGIDLQSLFRNWIRQ